MIYLKKFENFDTDMDRSKTPKMPEYNPVKNKLAKEYVDDNLYGGEHEKILKQANIDIPKNMDGEQLKEYLQNIEQELIEYFTDNFEKIKTAPELGININKGIDVPITNNIGGVYGSAAT